MPNGAAVGSDATTCCPNSQSKTV